MFSSSGQDEDYIEWEVQAARQKRVSIAHDLPTYWPASRPQTDFLSHTNLEKSAYACRLASLVLPCALLTPEKKIGPHNAACKFHYLILAVY
jgi:hypothetical protein